MLIQNKTGNLATVEISQRKVDYVLLEWHESGKRILRKTTQSGKEIAIQFLNKNPEFTEGDILFADDETIIAVCIQPCECIVLQPKNMFEMATMCYEIGNKHLPLFYEAGQLLVPFEMPLFKLLSAQNFEVQQATKKLLQPLKTTVTPHNVAISDNLFSTIVNQQNLLD